VNRGAGVHVEHPVAERYGPSLPDPLRIRRRRDGIPAPLVTSHYLNSGTGAIPERGPPETSEFGLGAWEPYVAALAQDLTCGQSW
jgi:hypothetical protein